MSRYTLTITLILFAFVSCAQKSQSLHLNQVKTIDRTIDNEQARADAYVLIAMDAYERGDFKTASLFFEKLYDIDPQKDYLTDAIKAASMSKDYKRIKHLIEKGKGTFGDDTFINRYLVAYYLDQRDLPKARAIVEKLLQHEPDQKDYELAAIIAKVEGKIEKAREYYQKAYQLHHDPKVAIALSEIYLNTNKPDKAIRLLETHIRIYGCEKIICSALIKIYTQKQDLQALASIYKKLYEATDDPLYANALLELYAYQKKYDAAIAFLKKHHFDDEILLDVYTAKKDYKHALSLAKKLYKERGDLRFLAKAAVLEYESSRKKTKALLKRVLNKFEKSVYHLDDPLYYNYYAYLLIDHEIDIPKGIELVKKALKAEPDSLFYIDTLAWAYYKQGKCKEAYKLLQPYESDKSQEEIVEHIEKIKKCLKEKTK